MLATLAETYVRAINNGAVPNIESAWTYLCKSECSKALDEALAAAEEALSTITLPMNEGDLQAAIKGAKKEALAIF
jgi:hypothetical protein